MAKPMWPLQNVKNKFVAPSNPNITLKHHETMPCKKILSCNQHQNLMLFQHSLCFVNIVILSVTCEWIF